MITIISLIICHLFTISRRITRNMSVHLFHVLLKETAEKGADYYLTNFESSSRNLGILTIFESPARWRNSEAFFQVEVFKNKIGCGKSRLSISTDVIVKLGLRRDITRYTNKKIIFDIIKCCIKFEKKNLENCWLFGNEGSAYWLAQLFFYMQRGNRLLHRINQC